MAAQDASKVAYDLGLEESKGVCKGSRGRTENLPSVPSIQPELKLQKSWISLHCRTTDADLRKEEGYNHPRDILT